MKVVSWLPLLSCPRCLLSTAAAGRRARELDTPQRHGDGVQGGERHTHLRLQRKHAVAQARLCSPAGGTPPSSRLSGHCLPPAGACCSTRLHRSSATAPPTGPATRASSASARVLNRSARLSGWQPGSGQLSKAGGGPATQAGGGPAPGRLPFQAHGRSGAGVLRPPAAWTPTPSCGRRGGVWVWERACRRAAVRACAGTGGRGHVTRWCTCC
jgi:hypothetical protein